MRVEARCILLPGYSISLVNPVYILLDAVWTNVLTLQLGKFYGQDRHFGPSVQLSLNGGEKSSVYSYNSQVEVALNWLYPNGGAGRSK